ncbi:MAG: hypothetical protein PHP54_02010 [Clostridia bacterium]|nr:hypothetical protein [Clostridia bacterium]
MKKDVFMIWLKEFCSLIFTQTVQAFLLAIIMSVVVATATTGRSEDVGNTASATGLIAIIALASLSKIEILVKKIFGVESQFGDPAMHNGHGALMGGLIAAKLAGRALNNVPKIAGGIKGVIGTRKTKANALAKMNRDIAAANGKIADPNNNSLGSGGNGEGDSNSGNIGIVSTTSGGTSSTGGTLKESMNRLSTALEKATPAFEKSATATANAAGKLTQEKFNKINDDYEKALGDIKKSKRENIAKIVSGTLETASLPIGALAGGTVSAAMGDNILKGAGVGVGVTDLLSEKMVSATNSAIDFASDMKSIGKATQAAIDAVNKASRSVNGPGVAKANSYREAKQVSKNTINTIRQRTNAGNMD